MIHIRNISFKFKPVILTKFYSKSVSSDDVSWSSGEKQRPVSWRHNQTHWYKIPQHLIYPHKLDPKDPEQKYPYKREDGGIQYFNFIYYPRFSEEEDPPIKPTPLLFVYRTHRTKHRPYWEKNILTKLGLGGYLSNETAICKNIPEVNAMLWQVKHLVKILPLKFPENMPEDHNPMHYFIQDNGEVLYNPSCNITKNDLEPEESETSMSPKWVNDQTRIIYENSLKVEF